MTENNLQQIRDLLGKSKSVALLLPAEVELDKYCAAFALKVTLEASGAAAAIFSSAQQLPKPPFLESIEIRNRFSQSDQFGVRISTAHAKPGELRYEVEPDAVVVYLKTESGEFLPDDVSVLPVRQKFDLFISLGVSRLEQLGSLYTDNAAVFFDVPHINIDTNPSNEYFGTVNQVVTTSTSLSELVLEILDSTDALSKEPVATSLLAGIIAETHSFRDPRTSPKSLAAAAKLINAGAKQQDIIQYLFKTKPFPELQLWGRALARLATVPTASLIHSLVTKSDMEKTNSNEALLPEVLRDLVEIVSGFNIIVLIAELPEEHQMLIAGLPHAGISAIAAKLGGEVKTPQTLVGQFEFVKVTFRGKTSPELQDILLKAVSSK